MKKLSAVLFALVILLTGCVSLQERVSGKQRIDVLILPKFEEGELYGDFPGEAQFFYEGYFRNCDEYEVAGSPDGNKLFVRDNLALFVTGMGKVNAATSLVSLLTDSRFDFSKALIVSTGCAGGAVGHVTLGDVCIVSAVIDGDLGHTADIRDMNDKSAATWFHDPDFDSSSFKKLNSALVNRAYNLTKDIGLETTENTVACMRNTFGDEEWAVRAPKVIRGSEVSSDNYWKGKYGHGNAVLMTETYGCSDPYAVCDMEDAALAAVLDRFGLLENFLVIRDCVDIDVFMKGCTPENLWSGSAVLDNLASDDGRESADIFATAMENNWKVSSVIIDTWLSGLQTI